MMAKDTDTRPVQLLKLSKLCLEKGLSKQQLTALMKPIREADNPAIREQIAQRLIEEVKKM